MKPSLVWDSIARKYVERTDLQELAVQTFGELPTAEKRHTFEVPVGHEAVRDSSGRATGELRNTTTGEITMAIGLPTMQEVEPAAHIGANDNGRSWTIRNDVSGAMPVNEKTLVEIEMRSGARWTDFAGAHSWLRRGDGADIVAYRIVSGANDNRARKGDWLQTFSGRQFFPMDPRADEVFIEDIAHALAMQCRYAGHCLQFYSVAEHCVHLARYFMARGASPVVCRWALLHDASEAYLVDVPRPVKPYLVGYKPAEAVVMRAICDRFGLPHTMPPEVHVADGRIIANERANMAPCVAEWSGYSDPLDGITLQYWSPDVADIYFMDAFKKLFPENMRAAA